MERWRPIKKFIGRYSISDQGRVRSEARYVNKGVVGTVLLKEIIMMLQEDKDGYVIINLSKNSKSHPKKVHQLVAEAFIGPKIHGKDVCHINSCRKNNCYKNLYYGTKAENIDDMKDVGSLQIGEYHSTSKITCSHVVWIHKQFRKGYSQQYLADQLGVSRRCVRAALNGETWNPSRLRKILLRMSASNNSDTEAYSRLYNEYQTLKEIGNFK